MQKSIVFSLLFILILISTAFFAWTQAAGLIEDEERQQEYNDKLNEKWKMLKLAVRSKNFEFLANFEIFEKFKIFRFYSQFQHLPFFQVFELR